MLIPVIRVVGLLIFQQSPAINNTDQNVCIGDVIDSSNESS